MFQDSSESSDVEATVDSSTLDFSYSMMDSESISIHLKNSIIEQLDAAASRQDLLLLQIDATESESHSNKSTVDSTIRSVRHKENKGSGAGQLGSEEDISFDTITKKLLLDHNMMTCLPFEVTLFTNLQHLNLSSNNLTHLNDFVLTLTHLKSLHLQNNFISNDGLPKDLSVLKKLTELNLSRNQLTILPPNIYKIENLKYLYLGNNEISHIHPEIKALQCLQVLNLGGNELVTVPDELGELSQLSVLVLCENKLQKLPRAVSRLKRLRSLLLHKNQLCCLPVEIVKLRSLKELGIRDNPLVRRFLTCCIKELLYNPPTLRELAARVIKLRNISYEEGEIPRCLEEFLNSGHQCVNPKCKGMYFTSCVEHVKFVDFCGMYRVPLMHYLCSSRCTTRTPSYYRTSSESETDDEKPEASLKKILLG